jgi:hypothetical protein
MGIHSITAIFIAAWEHKRASSQTRTAFLKFFQAGHRLGLFREGVTAPRRRETRHRSALRKWARKNGIRARAHTNRDPKAWGPQLWKFLKQNVAAAYYNAKNFDDARVDCWTMLQSLGALLPCPTCRKNYPALIVPQKWAKVQEPVDYERYVMWMENQVAKRIA